MMRIPVIILLAILVPAALQAGGKKEPALTVSFHLEDNPGSGKKHSFVQKTAGRDVTYRRSAEIATRDVQAFASFPADDKQSYGVVLQLNKTAAQRLSSITAANRGKLLLAVVNGQVRDAVMIDQQINDGMLVVWKWINLAEVRMADNLVPRIGEDPKAWKKRIKDSK